ncbi:hypothetical protein SUGI_0434770 [Cryptomeria japonica]|uniref:serine/threonine receptor-like kinase NFP n=1 Tax=Cryptomeria japonica TaxID=3369 RepID=UPI0024089B94|nr:serine/threonine receptor-like kinase NFP [Cryptomeria japonica]GLJ23038.1 hypothetical protein SUGI_0434770 [Cryptomeria japonica]
MGNPVLYCWFLVLLLQVWHIQAQGSEASNLTGYTCSDGPSPCHTYVFYKAQAPNFLTLDPISDLFGVSKLMIEMASNLVDENTQLVDGQLLLIPIVCGCMGNVSQANVTYWISGDDTFYLVSTQKFGNLTTYQAVELANPKLDVYNLTNGTEVVFPLRCRCPTKEQLKKGMSMLITYVLDQNDTWASINRSFGADYEELVSVNGRIDFDSSASNSILIPVSQKPVLPQTLDLSIPPISSLDEDGKGNSHRVLLIGFSVGGLVGLLAFGSAYLIRQRSSRLAKVFDNRKQPPCQNLKVMTRNESGQEELLAGVNDCLGKPLTYSLDTVRKATQNFSPVFHIEGSVYRGIIHDQEVAIKHIKGDVSQELKLLLKVNHGNLVRLEGFCITPEGQSYLIYEYAENRSLNRWLYHNYRSSNTLKRGSCSSSSVFLTWKTRLRIALDVATGLEYIHEHTNPTVVHKDLKSSNILLDSNFRAKIANFGMAKSLKSAVTKHIKGTEGYMAPEYLAHGLVTPKLDVFAFGVVLLELMSGKEAIVRDENGVPIAGKAGLLWTQIRSLLEGKDAEEKLRKWMDPNLQSSYNIDSAVSLVVMARACVEEDTKARPSMGDIVYKLSKLLDACVECSESSWVMDESMEIVIPIAGR